MKRLFLALALFFPALAYGQGSNYANTVFGSTGRPLGGGIITVCAANAPGVPCQPTVNIFQDQALTIAQSNPIISDGLGNYSFWAAPNTYTITISGTGISAKSYQVVLPCIVGASCASAGGLPNSSVTFSTTPSFAASQNASYSTVLTANITAITITGTPVNGNLLRFSFDQDATGGHTVVWPGNFIFADDFAFRVLPLAKNKITFVYNGTNWHQLDNIPDGALDYYPVTFSATPTLSNSRSAVFDMTLTGNVTSSVFTTTGRAGTQFVLNACQDGVGGRTFAFPGNVSNPQGFIFDTTASHCNRVLYSWTGALWIGIGGTGSGGANPAGNTGDVQLRNGSALSASGANDDGTNFTLDRDFHPKGPNPFVDVMRYGVRGLNSFTAIPAVAGITGTINSGSASLAVSTSFCGSQTSNVCFVNGDGIVVVGAGATETMTTPVIASVTQSNPSGPDGTNTVVTGPAGSTTYNYKLISVDKGRGMTVASATVSTTTGQASLGKQTVSITSCSRSGVTVTCLTAAPHTMAVGTLVYLGQMSDGTFAGWYRTATVPDNTHFTYTSGFDTASGASVSETGGTALWKNENFIQWVHPATGAAPQQYIICSDRGGAGFVPIGISKVDNNAISATDLALGFDDLGSPMMDNFNLPYWLPANACTAGTPQNDELVTTISSGAGTTTLTLAATATNSVTTSPVLLDNVPNFLTAVTAAGAGPLNIPTSNGTFVFNSYVTLPTFANICQLGTILINDTVELVSGNRWSGDCPPRNNSVQSFAWEGHPQINVGPAYPGFYQRSATIGLHALAFNSFSGNQKVLVQQDGTAVPSGAMSDLNFNFSGSNEYTGMGLFMRIAGANNPSNVIMSGKFAFIGGNGDGTQGNTNAPLFYNQGGGIVLDNISFAKRGLAFKTGISGADIAIIKNIYENGGVSPLIMFTNAAGISLSFDLGRIQIDTVPHPLFVNLSTGSTNLKINDLVFSPSSDGTSAPPTISGFATPVTGITNGPGYNNAISGSNFTNNEVSVYGTTGSIGYAIPTPAAPTSCAVSAGGGVPIASNIPYSIVAIDANGNYSPPSAPCLATTTSGQQTVTIVPPARPTGAVTYQVVRAASQQFVNVGATRWTSNIVDTFGFTNGAVPNSAGQQSGLSIGTFVAPQVIVTGGGFKDTINFPGTADRTFNLPDANPVFPTISGIVPTSGYQNSAYDNFNRADGGLGANWTSFLPSATFIAPAIVSNQYSLNTNGKAMMAFWGANTFANDQFSQITVTGDVSANSTHFVAVRFSASGGYHCTLVSGASASHIARRDNTGALTNLTSVTLTPAVGDVIRCEVVGTTINFYQNGTLASTVVDSTFASGAPGSGMFINAAVTTSLDNWSGGNLHPISQLDAEQDWTQSQHIAGALTVGPTNPIVGALAAGTVYGTQAILTGGITTGATPPACTVGTAGAWCANEGTAPTGLASADEQWADSITHGLNYNANNGGVSSFSGAWNCTNVTPVTVSANVTTDQNLMTCTVPAGTLNRALRTMKVSLAGVYSTPAASTAVITVKVKVGSLTVATWTSTALGGIQATNDQFNIEDAKFTVQTAGASGAFEAHGNLIIDLGIGNTVADSVFADVNTATVGTVDLTASQTLQVTIAFSAASASNTATQRQLVLETVN